MPPQRRNWKRCASHVYIAHFIEYQIHKDRCASPLAAAAKLGRYTHLCWAHSHPPDYVAMIGGIIRCHAASLNCMTGISGRGYHLGFEWSTCTRCRLQKQQRQALRALGADAAASPDLLRANGAAATAPPDAAGRSPAAEVHSIAATSSAAMQPLPLLNGSQA